MKLKLLRYKSTDKATIGRLFINNRFECYTLEDEYRQTKVKHETRIPAGTYIIKLRKYGKWHERMRKRYVAIHKGMMELVDVPNFTDILIHPGNKESDTSGCILVGSEVDEKNMVLLQSTKAYLTLYIKVTNAMVNNELVTIEIIDKDKNA